jgi:hypothetical protein
VSSVPTSADSVTGLDLLMDAAGFGTVTGLAQVVSHKIFARQQLPGSWWELMTRYVAGSSIVALGVSAWALRRPQASGRDAAALLWLTLVANGLVVGGCHYFDHQLAEAAKAEGKKIGAEALRQQFVREERGEFPAPVVRRAGAGGSDRPAG